MTSNEDFIYYANENQTSMNDTENNASYQNLTKRNSQHSLPVSVQNPDSFQGTRFEPHKFIAEIDIV